MIIPFLVMINTFSVVQKVKDEQYKYVSVFISSHGGMRLIHQPGTENEFVLHHHIECIEGNDGDPWPHYPTFLLLDMFNIQALEQVTKIFVIQVIIVYFGLSKKFPAIRFICLTRSTSKPSNMA